MANIIVAVFVAREIMMIKFDIKLTPGEEQRGGRVGSTPGLAVGGWGSALHTWSLSWRHDDDDDDDNHHEDSDDDNCHVKHTNT